jgi:hypothetical protein
MNQPITVSDILLSIDEYLNKGAIGTVDKEMLRESCIRALIFDLCEAAGGLESNKVQNIFLEFKHIFAKFNKINS